MDIPAQDCIWKEFLHHETHLAHPSASLKSLDKKKRSWTFLSLYEAHSIWIALMAFIFSCSCSEAIFVIICISQWWVTLVIFSHPMRKNHTVPHIILFDHVLRSSWTRMDTSDNWILTLLFQWLGTMGGLVWQMTGQGQGQHWCLHGPVEPRS